MAKRTVVERDLFRRLLETVSGNGGRRMSITAAELKGELMGFIGSTEYFRLTLLPIKCTEGIKHLADVAGAYWLVDVIASYQTQKNIREVSFQSWNLTVKGNEGYIEMWDMLDDDKKVLVRQDFTYTDFPEGEWKFYVKEGASGPDVPKSEWFQVLMLPSED
jgi:hypothetical protein